MESSTFWRNLPENNCINGNVLDLPVRKLIDKNLAIEKSILGKSKVKSMKNLEIYIFLTTLVQFKTGFDKKSLIILGKWLKFQFFLGQLIKNLIIPTKSPQNHCKYVKYRSGKIKRKISKLLFS